MENVLGPDEGAKTDCLVCCDSPKIQREQGTDGIEQTSTRALSFYSGEISAALWLVKFSR